MIKLRYSSPASSTAHSRPQRPSSASSTTTTPRGLWKRRKATPQPTDSRSSFPLRHPKHAHSNSLSALSASSGSSVPGTELCDHDSPDEDASSSASSSSKRRRISGAFNLTALSPDLAIDLLSSTSSHRPSSLSSSRPHSSAASPTATAHSGASKPLSIHDLRLPLSSLSTSHSPSPDSHHSYSPPSLEPPPLMQHMNIDLPSAITPSSSLASSASSSFKGKDKAPPSNMADYEDWLNLKVMFARAVEMSDAGAEEDPSVLPLLRAILNECHRIMRVHPDPSVIYLPRHSTPIERPQTRGGIGFSREATPADFHVQSGYRVSPHPLASYDLPSSSFQHHGSHSLSPPTTHPSALLRSYAAHPIPSKAPDAFPDLPTSFHTLLGTTLFLFGSIISSLPPSGSPSRADFLLPNEPKDPCVYWDLACDVFETGESLPRLIDGASSSLTEAGGRKEASEDWRMAIAWGRALVCLAELKCREEIERQKTMKIPPSPAIACFPSQPYNMMGGSLPMVLPPSQPKWSRDSLFHLIMQSRPGTSTRGTVRMSAHEMLMLARDQFSRGVFHMPRAGSSHHTQSLPVTHPVWSHFDFNRMHVDASPAGSEPSTSTITSYFPSPKIQSDGRPFPLSRSFSSTTTLTTLTNTSMADSVFSFTVGQGMESSNTSVCETDRAVSPTVKLEDLKLGDEDDDGMVFDENEQDVSNVPPLSPSNSSSPHAHHSFSPFGDMTLPSPPVLSTASTSGSTVPGTATAIPPPSLSPSISSSSTAPSFSRPRLLFTLASEVLSIAERLPEAQRRIQWAKWSDSILNQIKMENEGVFDHPHRHHSLPPSHHHSHSPTHSTSSHAFAGSQSNGYARSRSFSYIHAHDESYWRAGGGGMRGSIVRARGRCWLVIGSAWSEGVEAALEWDSSSSSSSAEMDKRGAGVGREGEEEEKRVRKVLESEDAEEAREALEKAVQFFERAKGMGEGGDHGGSGAAGTGKGSGGDGDGEGEDGDGDVEDVSPLLAEALLTLANLTIDENKREELYSRAEKEVGGAPIFEDEDDVEDVPSHHHSADIVEDSRRDDRPSAVTSNGNANSEVPYSNGKTFDFVNGSDAKSTLEGQRYKAYSVVNTGGKGHSLMNSTDNSGADFVSWFFPAKKMATTVSIQTEAVGEDGVSMDES